jgi:hypothetical protein
VVTVSGHWNASTCVTHCYRDIYHAPPADSSRTLKHIISCLDYISRIHPSTGFVSLGDFNRLNDSSNTNYPQKQVVKCATASSIRFILILPPITISIISMPPVGKSDHNCVLLMSANRYPYYDRSGYFVNVRCNDTHGKILFSNALQNYNWSAFYRMEKCEDMLNYFNNVFLCLFDYHLPVCVYKRNKCDKPWVDDNFRRLIRCRQYAWKYNNMADYRR